MSMTEQQEKESAWGIVLYHWIECTWMWTRPPVRYRDLEVDPCHVSMVGVTFSLWMLSAVSFFPLVDPSESVALGRGDEEREEQRWQHREWMVGRGISLCRILQTLLLVPCASYLGTHEEIRNRGGKTKKDYSIVKWKTWAVYILWVII